MHFTDESTQDVAIEFMREISDRLQAAVEASRAPLSDDLMTRIEQLEDRLVGLRELIHDTHDALQALLRNTCGGDE